MKKEIQTMYLKQQWNLILDLFLKRGGGGSDTKWKNNPGYLYFDESAGDNDNVYNNYVFKISVDTYIPFRTLTLHHETSDNDECN